MQATPTTKDAFDLFLRGSIALAKMEHNGIKVDVDYLDRAITEVTHKVADLEREMEQDDFHATWKRAYGERMKVGSYTQMGDILFNHLGYKSTEKTPTGRDKTSKSVLEKIDHPYLKKFIRVQNLKKSRSTYLEGIKREVVNGFVHPSFNLNTVETMRSSANMPNVHNVPVRDPWMAEMIRRCYIPRKGRVLAEIDYGALEFRVAACFWKDPRMISYASDPTLDIHRDLGSRCYAVEPELVSKDARYCGKNGFVFPRLYGSYYLKIAQNMWEMIDDKKLRAGHDAESLKMKKHLRLKGIKGLGDCDEDRDPRPGTFEHHIKKVQDWFDKEFAVFTRDKKKWIEEYQRTGEFTMMTGFRIAGMYNNNFLLNVPIQGPGFHLLLWSLIEIQKEIEKQKMRTKLVNEIHDCLLGDVPHDELQDFLHLCREVMTERVRKHWDWVIVPMTVEVDVANDNWHNKKPWVEYNGVWGPKERKAA